MGYLHVEKGTDKGKGLTVSAGKPVTVGREQRCDLPIRDVMVSRKHFQVRFVFGGQYVVRDLRSSNGTFLNGRRLDPDEDATLEVEDEIQAGSTCLTLLADEAAASAGGKGELTGRTLGGYKVMERLGRGAMGTVYKALQVSLDRRVALKILARDLSSDASLLELFLSEARAAGKLNHPNIVPVFDVGTVEGITFFSMELMERGSVEDLIREQGKLPVPRALRIAVDCAKGLEYAERQGIVHRDVKPANLMVNAEGVAKIGDLGIARAASARATTAGAEAVADADELVAGSPAYMAPEQARGGGVVSNLSDLYALGATLFHILTGEPPFSGSSPREVIMKHLEEAPRRVDAVDPGVPGDVADVVARLLEKDPAARPQKASALLDELRVLALRYPETWTPGSPPVTIGDSGRRPSLLGGIPAWQKAAIGAVAVLAVAGPIGVKVVSWKLQQRLEKRQEEERRKLDEAQKAAAAERERAAAAARAREKAAADALKDLNSSIQPGTSLEEAQSKYRAIASKYRGTRAAEEAAVAAKTIDDDERKIEKQKRERAETEAAAQRDAGAVIEALESERTPLRDLTALFARSDEIARARAGTEVAEKKLPEARRKAEKRIDAESERAGKEVDDAIRTLDFAGARAAVSRVDALGLARLSTWVESRRRAIDDGERAARDAALKAAREREAQEIASVDRADEEGKRRKLQYGDVVRALEELKRAGLQMDAARARLESRLFTLRAEAQLKELLLLHVKKGAVPRLKRPLGSGVDGEAVAADEDGLTFRSRDGQVEVPVPFAKLSRDEVEGFMGSIPNLRAIDRFAFAYVCYDQGDAERGKREYERAWREGDPEFRAKVQALSAAASKAAPPARPGNGD